MQHRRVRSLLVVAALLTAAPAGAQGAAAPGAAAQPSAARHTAALAWLAGCWERRTARGLVEEQWTAPRGGLLLGTSRTTRGDSVVEYEQMRIHEVGDTLVFTASPSRQATTSFRAGAAGAAGGVTFENPAHDFPQRVRYAPAAGGDSLLARIEGTRDGRTRGVDFPYARVACPGRP